LKKSFGQPVKDKYGSDNNDDHEGRIYFFSLFSWHFTQRRAYGIAFNLVLAIEAFAVFTNTEIAVFDLL